ncbi:MAG: hypothetical protein II801_05825 [Bacteroidaceae bacterium]|nr:hypothetical protein [Bacteroidaceae bacterium]
MVQKFQRSGTVVPPQWYRRTSKYQQKKAFGQMLTEGFLLWYKDSNLE